MHCIPGSEELGENRKELAVQRAWWPVVETSVDGKTAALRNFAKVDVEGQCKCGCWLVAELVLIVTT